MKTYIKIFAAFVLCSCASWKQEMLSYGDYNSAIKNAIIDFANTSPLMKDDKIFSVSYKEINNNIIGISILGNPNQFYIDDGKPNALPSNYIKIKNKLFYWGDSDSIKDKTKVIKKLEEYKLIEYNADIWEIKTDDSKKGQDYYFCKDNLINYTRVKSSIAMGYYKAKLPKCTE